MVELRNETTHSDAFWLAVEGINVETVFPRAWAPSGYIPKWRRSELCDMTQPNVCVYDDANETYNRVETAWKACIAVIRTLAPLEQDASLLPDGDNLSGEWDPEYDYKVERERAQIREELLLMFESFI